MEKSLFFNALRDSSYETGYDRNYDADDISDWLSVFISTGIVKSTNGLKIVADSGMNVKVNAGKGAINGKPYKNDNYLSFTVPTAPTGATSRIDAIILRYDKTINNRDISVKYITGNADGSIPTLQRDAIIYELMLGYITVAPSTLLINQSNITDLRGDNDTQITLLDGTIDYGYCPYSTATKGYEDYYDAITERYKDYVTVSSQTTTVTTALSSNLYKPATDLASVYLNGKLVEQSDYTLTIVGGFIVITFTFNVLAGQIVGLVVDRFYDGEGLPNVLQDYLDLKQQVEILTNQDDYIYVCNGENDNVLLSQIAQTWLNGGTDYGSKTIRVYGSLGITAPNSGDGTSASRYNIFDFGVATAVNRKIIFDFSGCSQITAPLTNGLYYTVFAGKQIYVKNASVVASNTTSNVVIFDIQAQYIEADNCRFWINALSTSYIARTGTFTNCRGSVSNVSGNSYCFWVVGDSLLRVINGEYYCYAVSGSESSVVWMANAGIGVAIMEGVNCPTLQRSGFVQSRYINHSSGGYFRGTNTITLLPAVVNVNNGIIVNTIQMTKPSIM